MPNKHNKKKQQQQQQQQEHQHSASCSHNHEHSHSHGGGHEHDHEHSHSHGGGHDHEHSHSHGGHEHHEHREHSHSHGHGNCDHDHGHAHEQQQQYIDPLIELSQRLASTKLSTNIAIAEKNAKVGSVGVNGEHVVYTEYIGEQQMGDIMALIEKDLSEPYSIFTYRYFISDWPKLCILAMIDSKIIGVVVCKLEKRIKGPTRLRGYIAMLAVDTSHRKLGIGSRLVREAISKMIQENADEVVLETEIKNHGALALYETLGFVRDKRLHKYYLNGGDAFRLVLPITPQFLAPVVF